MAKHKDMIQLSEVKINCHDPRHHQEFLLLSNSINAWKKHVHDRSWWLAQENQCLDIFNRHGYDLQSGVWFCLISCQRHGWAGIANATQLLAEGFTKKQRQCWPPLAATDLRQQIIDCYSTYATTCVYGLPLSSAEAATLQQLEGAVAMMQAHSVSLQSRSQAALRNLANYLQASRQAIQKRALVVKSPLERQTEPVETAPPPVAIPAKAPPARQWKALLSGGIAGIILMLGAVSMTSWLQQPSTIISFNKIWPGNPWFTRWQNRLNEQIASLPSVNSWVLLNQQLSALEQQLLETEQKRKPYMTISELKTAIYQMQQTLQQGKKPVQAQLDELQQKQENQQPISELEVYLISQHLEALNSRLIQLTTKH